MTDAGGSREGVVTQLCGCAWRHKLPEPVCIVAVAANSSSCHTSPRARATHSFLLGSSARRRHLVDLAAALVGQHHGACHHLVQRAAPLAARAALVVPLCHVTCTKRATKSTHCQSNYSTGTISMVCLYVENCLRRRNGHVRCDQPESQLKESPTNASTA